MSPEYRSAHLHVSLASACVEISGLLQIASHGFTIVYCGKRRIRTEACHLVGTSLQPRNDRCKSMWPLGAICQLHIASPLTGTHCIRSHGLPKTIPAFIGEVCPSVPMYLVIIPAPSEKPMPYIGASGKRFEMYSIAFLRSYVAPAL